MAHNGSAEKPRVLILGGTGFIGRNLVHYLVTNDLVDKIRVVDKVIPQMAWLNKKHKDVFDKVECRHANLISEKSVISAFDCDDGKKFDFVINCAAETKYSQMDSVYKEGIYKLSMNCAHQAALCDVKVYIEVSTTQLKSSQAPITEESDVDPWTSQAKYKLQVERNLASVNGLNCIIVRPAIVYGPGDKLGLTPRLIIGAVYKYLNERMKVLWTRDLKMNTVHVNDLCRAIWHLCLNGKVGETYIVADKANTTQGDICDRISELFGVNHNFVGPLVSSMAKITLSEIIEDINDKHMAPWGEACQKDGIVNTPLNPHINQELLDDHNTHVDGSKIEATGFYYEHPRVTAPLLKEVLDDYVKMGLFPPSLVAS